MTDERYDGSKILSDLSGIPVHDVKKIFEDVKLNLAKLQGCPRHRVEGPRPAPGVKLTCLNCGGTIGLLQLLEYLRGFKAAGGNPEDVWPTSQG